MLDKILVWKGRQFLTVFARDLGSFIGGRGPHGDGPGRDAVDEHEARKVFIGGDALLKIPTPGTRSRVRYLSHEGCFRRQGNLSHKVLRS